MERNHIEQSVTNYIAEVESSIQDHAIERELGVFPIKREQAFFLLLPMLNGEYWTEEMNRTAIAVSAVHAAFDAHDRVQLHDASSISQQLLVLAGDHFSGVHYKILAALPDFRFIRQLSDAIGFINEEKTKLFMNSQLSVKERIDTIRVIEGTCIIRFYEHFGFERYAELATEVLLFQSIKSRWMNVSQNASELECVLDEISERIEQQITNCIGLEPTIRQEIIELVNPQLGKLI